MRVRARIAGSIAGVVLCLSLTAAAGVPAAPVLVELFTSQGCSSCPAADKQFAKLIDRPDVVALAFHVDYWNYIGWVDPFSSPEASRRQDAHMRSLGTKLVYTPQMVIDGRAEMTGIEWPALRAAIEKSAKRPKLPVQLSVDAGRNLKILVPAGPKPEGDAGVWLMVFDRKHVTAVERGENQGKTLVNFNVVRQMSRLATWTGQPYEVAMRLPSQGDGVAVIVHPGLAGPVLAAGQLMFKQPGS